MFRHGNGANAQQRQEAFISPDILGDPSLLLPLILVGFFAQLIDGALGMAYGQISSTLLIALGVPPKFASASVHTAETFTTGVSAISHVAHRNVDWRLFMRIVIPGVIGGILGAYVLTATPADVAKPIVLTYLTCTGLYLFYRGVMHRHTEKRPRIVEPLGLVGGFLDAAGGGEVGDGVAALAPLRPPEAFAAGHRRLFRDMFAGQFGDEAAGQ